MFAQQNYKQDEMAQVWLDGILDIQKCKLTIPLGLGIDRTGRDEGEIHLDHP